jgi:hypothetical protein
MDRELPDVALMTYGTADGTATKGQDYSLAIGELRIPAGQRSGQVVVDVHGDTVKEQDEQFYVDLTAIGDNIELVNNRAVGVILDDDEEPPPPPPFEQKVRDALQQVASEHLSWRTHFADAHEKGVEESRLGNLGHLETQGRVRTLCMAPPIDNEALQGWRGFWPLLFDAMNAENPDTVEELRALMLRVAAVLRS